MTGLYPSLVKYRIHGRANYRKLIQVFSRNRELSIPSVICLGCRYDLCTSRYLPTYNAIDVSHIPHFEKRREFVKKKCLNLTLHYDRSRAPTNVSRDSRTSGCDWPTPSNSWRSDTGWSARRWTSWTTRSPYPCSCRCAICALWPRSTYTIRWWTCSSSTPATGPSCTSTCGSLSTCSDFSSSCGRLTAWWNRRVLNKM